jgi:hypothetical protein
MGGTITGGFTTGSTLTVGFTTGGDVTIGFGAGAGGGVTIGAGAGGGGGGGSVTGKVIGAAPTHAFEFDVLILPEAQVPFTGISTVLKAHAMVLT